MIPLDALHLPDEMLQKLRALGYNSVWDLHASNKYTLRIRSRLSISAEEVDQIVAAMRAIGWDFKDPADDPVGAEDFPSAVVLRNLLTALRLNPRSSRFLRYYLRGVSTLPELLKGIEPDDTETIIGLLRLMKVEDI